MASDSIASTTRSTTGSHSPTIAGGVQHKTEDTTSPTRFGFVTPTRFVARHEFSKSHESPPRKKHRSNVSSSVYCQRVARSTSTGRTVLHLDFLHDDAPILPILGLSNVPNDEFILARPNQVSSFEIEFPTYKERPRTVSISANDADADTYPIADSEEIFGFLEDEHRDSPRPPSIPSMFLPIDVQHVEASLSELHMTNTSGNRLRLKPRPRKRTAHHGTRSWDP
jgi:hypothetical protein